MGRHKTLAEIAERTARRRAQGVNQAHPGGAAPAAPVRSKKPLPVLPCEWARELTGVEREAAKLDHRKKWNWCDHPQDGRGRMNGREGLPLGRKIVCPCEGCGPSCPGYLPDGAPDWRSVEGWLSDEEAAAYGELLATLADAEAVEIGTHHGRSAAFAATALLGRNVRLHCIDPWANDPAIEADARRNLAPFGAAVVLHKERSIAAAQKWSRLAPIACLYVDGLHEYESVVADLDAWLPHVISGGWVCGHDYQLPDVKRAVDERFGALVRHVGDEYGFWWVARPAPPPPPRPDFAVIPQPPALELTPTSRRAVVTAVVGDECELLHAASGPAQRAYAKRIGADYVVLRWEFPRLPIAVKFQIASVLSHYDRIAFLDADTYVHPATPSLFDACAPDEFGFCPENQSHPGFMMRDRYHRFRADMGFAPVADPLPWYMNTGVMVVPASHRHLFLPPDRPMHLGHMTEQHWVGAGLYDSGLPFRFLDARFNHQNWVDPGWRIAERLPWCVYHLSGIGGTRPQRAKTIAELAARHPWSLPLEKNP